MCGGSSDSVSYCAAMRGGPAPDPEEARRLYRALARRYDRRVRFVAPLRRRVVRQLRLSAGDEVVDMGCGTGASLALLRAAVGPEGRVTGVELSEEMAAVARQRIDDAGWDNVEVVVGDAASASLPSGTDGVLFFLTHDLMRTPQAVRRAVAGLRPGGRVVAFGPAWGPRWAVPVNLAVRAVSRPYVTTFEGFDRPWSHLADELADTRVRRLLLGGAYVAVACKTETTT
jgi:SAM-dependent methyltransferase